MKIWKDRQGNKVDAKEFFSRWKRGISQVASSPTYQLKSKLAGTRIMLVGFFCGFIMTVMYWESSWWIAIILFGGLITTGSQYIGTRQQLKLILNLEKKFKGTELKGGKI